MTQYNIVGASSLVTGQDEDISQVLANFEAIQAILNGNISSDNLKPGTTIPTPGPPGVYTKQDLIFNEPASAHDDLVAEWVVLLGTTVVMASAIPLVGPWNDNVVLRVGDTPQTQGYFKDVSVGDLATYDPTDSSGDGFITGYTASPSPDYRNISDAYYPNPGTFYSESDTITATVSGIATGGGGAKLLVRLLYFTASTDDIVAS